jgi:hypothetical protein
LRHRLLLCLHALVPVIRADEVKSVPPSTLSYSLHMETNWPACRHCK